MSRLTTESNPGVPVRSSNNVYTVLLIAALAVLASASAYLRTVNKERFGFSLPVGEQYEASQKEATDVSNDTMAQGRNITASMAAVRTAGSASGGTSAPEPAPQNP